MYYFRIYDTLSNELIETCDRTDFLVHWILYYFYDKKYDDWFYVIVQIDETTIQIVKWNPLTNDQKLQCTYKGFEFTYAPIWISESLNYIYFEEGDTSKNGNYRYYLY